MSSKSNVKSISKPRHQKKSKIEMSPAAEGLKLEGTETDRYGLLKVLGDIMGVTFVPVTEPALTDSVREAARYAAQKSQESKDRFKATFNAFTQDLIQAGERMIKLHEGLDAATGSAAKFIILEREAATLHDNIKQCNDTLDRFNTVLACK